MRPTDPFRRSTALLSALLFAGALGCAQRPPAPADSTPAPLPTPSAPATNPAEAATPGPAAPAEGVDWTLGPQGAGPVRFGMTLDELRAAAGEPDSLGPPGECSYVVPEGAPDGLAFMVVEGRVVRADVRRGSGVPTTIGVSAGDREERALELLGGETEVTPHKYVEGHYLTARTGARTGDVETWWVVATDGGTVTDVRAGLMPQVRWVEGCS